MRLDEVILRNDYENLAKIKDRSYLETQPKINFPCFLYIMEFQK